jgi:hypothetical protein
VMVPDHLDSPDQRKRNAMASSFGRTVVAILLVCVCHGANAGAIWSANGHEYEIASSNLITWDAARSAAQALGSGWDLASIGSAGENAFVTSLVDSSLPKRTLLARRDGSTAGGRVDLG